MQRENFGLKRASELDLELASERRLSSKIESFDSWLGGGIPFGQMTEWGLPSGHDARKIILRFLTQENFYSLWVYPEEDLEIYPPAWVSQKVDLQKVFFVKCDDPIRRLRPVFLENTFKLIILDGLKIKRGALAFLAHQMRRNQQSLFLLRKYLLNSRTGNPHSPLRLNAFWRSDLQRHEIESIRGGREENYHLKLA